MTVATLLQIDLQNLFYGARNKGEKVDFEKIMEYFNGRESEFLVDSIVYMIRSPSFDSKKFEVTLKKMGYNLRIKNATKVVSKNRVTYRQSNQDIPIAVDCLNKIDTFDKLILMSGDGDFAYLCEDLKKKGKQIEIWSFRECYNSLLSSFADKVCYIEEESFFYKRPKISVFGMNKGELR